MNVDNYMHKHTPNKTQNKTNSPGTFEADLPPQTTKTISALVSILIGQLCLFLNFIQRMPSFLLSSEHSGKPSTQLCEPESPLWVAENSLLVLFILLLMDAGSV